MKKKPALSILFISLIAIFLYIVISKPYLKTIELSVDGSYLSWNLTKDSNYKNYIIYNNGKEIDKTNLEDYLIRSGSDTTPPNKIENIKTTYNEDKISISWSNPNDVGSPNEYQIFLVDENNKIKAKSNKVTYIYSSDIKDYDVVIGDKPFITKDCKIDIPRETYKNEIKDIEVKAYDNKGNYSSNTFVNEYVNYILTLNNEQGKYTISNPDTSDEYTYSIIYNQRKSSLDSNTFILRNIIYDSNPPNEIINVKVNRDTDPITVSWDEIEDKNENVNFTIVAEGKRNKVKLSQDFSLPPKVTYLYSFTDYKSIMRTGASETSNNFVELNTENKDFYFNVAALDICGNKSQIYNRRICVESKDEALNNVMVRSENVPDYLFYPYYNYASNYLPENIIILLDEISTKVNIISEDVTNLYEEMSQKSSEDRLAGFFSSSKNSIYIEVNNDADTVIHEIGHAFDCYFFYTSEDNMFTNIYNAEKDLLFYGSDFYSEYVKSEPAEYFAEAFTVYFENEDRVKNSAPRTYEFIKNLVDSI